MYAVTKCENLCYKKLIKLENICRSWEKIPKFRALNEAVGPGKNQKLINVEPTLKVLHITFLALHMAEVGCFYNQKSDRNS